MDQLCGDPTCESSGCDPASLDRYYEQQEKDARTFIFGILNDQAKRLGLPVFAHE